MAYTLHMFEIIKSSSYETWLRGLRDLEAKARIMTRVRRLALGNPGQSRRLKGGVFELKIDYGPGYRVYYSTVDTTLILLLCGGDKSSQQDDIAKAERIAAQWKKENPS